VQHCKGGGCFPTRLSPLKCSLERLREDVEYEKKERRVAEESMQQLLDTVRNLEREHATLASENESLTRKVSRFNANVRDNLVCMLTDQEPRVTQKLFTILAEFEKNVLRMLQETAEAV